jgi:PIN domain nuclease of toxin-antitoxin system
VIQAVSDTHALIWYVWVDPRLSGPARAVFETIQLAHGQIAVSSISLVEVVYLEEKGKITAGTLGRILALLDLAELLIETPVDRAILSAPATIDRAQVPDMPDRIIAATALHLNVPLISRDRKIQASSVPTIW